MSQSMAQAENLWDHIAALSMLVTDHWGLIEEYIVPVARKVIHDGEEFLKAALRGPLWPSKKQLQEIIDRTIKKTRAEALIIRFRRQMRDLKGIIDRLNLKYRYLHTESFADNEDFVYVRNQQTELIRRSSKYCYALFEEMKRIEYEEKEMDDETELAVQTYIWTTPIDEKNVMAAMKTWGSAGNRQHRANQQLRDKCMQEPQGAETHEY